MNSRNRHRCGFVCVFEVWRVNYVRHMQRVTMLSLVGFAPEHHSYICKCGNIEIVSLITKG